MNIIDITRELFSAPVYPGDPRPELEPLSRIRFGDVCNTSMLHGCVHNGTHLDAPRHFVPDGTDTAEVPLDICIGECTVVEWDGVMLGADAERLLPQMNERVLFKGAAEITPSAAFVLKDMGIKLIGVEPQSVAPASQTAEVHRFLLGEGIVLLEGLDLSQVKPGTYFLFAPPLKMKECDGSPVRAILLERHR